MFMIEVSSLSIYLYTTWSYGISFVRVKEILNRLPIQSALELMINGIRENSKQKPIFSQSIVGLKFKLKQSAV